MLHSSLCAPCTHSAVCWIGSRKEATGKIRVVHHADGYSCRRASRKLLYVGNTSFISRSISIATILGSGINRPELFLRLSVCSIAVVSSEFLRGGKKENTGRRRWWSFRRGYHRSLPFVAIFERSKVARLPQNLMSYITSFSSSFTRHLLHDQCSPWSLNRREFRRIFRFASRIFLIILEEINREHKRESFL